MSFLLENATLFDSKKLLAIDDEEGLRRSIEIYFEDAGFIVFGANNGRKGIEIFNQENPDIVLVDLRMPEMDGIEVIRYMAKESPHTPVIVVSGTGVLEDALEAIRSGACDYVTKPVTDLMILEHTVKNALEKTVLEADNRMHQEHLEELVEKRTAELQHAQKIEAIGTLSGGIAHDFNNILSGVMGYNELALELCTETEVIGFMQEIKSGLQRAKELVSQILTFSHKGDQQLKPLKMADIVNESIKLIHSTIPASIHLKKEINCEASILANASKIHQVVMNLCTNAYYVMRETGGELSVSLRETTLPPEAIPIEQKMKSDAYIELCISDTGCGMDKETQRKIFNPYFTTKPIGRGTGLGMSVVIGIVDSCNGWITIDSELGKGTTFSVYFPIIKTEELKKEKQSDAALSIEGTERILFVDDEEVIIHLAQRAFSHYGYTITTFADPQEALTAYAATPAAFDLVLTDMTMPHMNGKEFALELLAITPDLPIILCSGFTEILTRESALEMGIKAYLQKPMPIIEIIKEIRKLFDEQ